MITQDKLKLYLHYNPETGIFTRIKSKNPIKYNGEISNTPNNRGYLHIRLCAERHKAHRLAWLYVYGNFPELNIDHINGVKTDNRICNLRECSQKENTKNVGKRYKNKSGVKGVSWHKLSGKWVAQATLNYKKKYLGVYKTVEEAGFAYQKFAKDNHGEFYKI